MRLLGVDQADGILESFVKYLTGWNSRICNSMAQVGTGEGKSVTLGILSTVFALLGCTVHCACYSKFLSERDAKAFASLWRLFGVEDAITYATINDLANLLLNSRGNVRTLTERLIAGKPLIDESRVMDEVEARSSAAAGAAARAGAAAGAGAGAASSSTPGPRILLIDEIDVLLSKDFLGATYNPLSSVAGAAVQGLINHIFELKPKHGL